MQGICQETRLRIKLSVWAYAYEVQNNSLASDAEFDFYSYMVDLKKQTSRVDMDVFFKTEFEPCTGMWIHKHPDLAGIENLY